MDKKTWIAEVDRDVLRFVVASNRGKKTKLLRTRLVALESDDAAVLRTKLREAADGLDLAGADGFVFVSDRRMVHGEISFDKKPKRQMRDRQILSSARDLGLWDAETPLSIGWQAVHDEGGKAKVAFDAAPRDLVESVTEAAAVLMPKRLWIASLEAAFAHAVEHESPDSTVAVLDIRNDHASFVLCKRGRVQSSRRFKLPFARDVDGFGCEALLPIAMEVARSLDFLKELGNDMPSRILVSGFIREHEFDAEMWSESFGSIETQIVAHESLALLPDAIQPPHAWIVPAIVLGKRREADLCWLHEPEVPSLVERGGRVLTYAASILAMAGGALLFAESKTEDARAAKNESVRLELEIEAMEERELAVATDNSGPSLHDRRSQALDELDRDRISVSRLCASLSIERPRGVKLTRVVVREDGGVVVAGVVKASERLAAMRDFGEFSRRLGTVLVNRRLGGSLGEALAGQVGIPFEIEAQRVRETSAQGVDDDGQ